MKISSPSILIFILQVLSTLASEDGHYTPFRDPTNTKVSVDKDQPPIRDYSSLLLPFWPFIYKNSTTDREGPSAFLVDGGVIDYRDIKPIFLCKINVLEYCQSKYIADIVELVVSFNPLYTYFQDIQPLRYSTHFNFLSYIQSFGMKVQVTEAIIPDQGQSFKVSSPGKEPWEVQLTVNDMIYYRENLVNVAARKLKGLWEYLIMIDGHEFFDNSYWWEEGVWRAEHYPIVQVFQSGYHLDKGSDENKGNQSIARFKMPAICYMETYKAELRNSSTYVGNGYIIRREIYEGISYIMDDCIGGGCDTSFFFASLSDDQRAIMFMDPTIARTALYYEQFKSWINNASKIFKGKNTYVRGNMLHFYHEEVFDYQKLMLLSNQPGEFIRDRDLYRDENFTLHLKNKELALKFENICYGPHPNVMFIYNIFGDRHKHILPFENIALLAGHYLLALFRHLI